MDKDTRATVFMAISILGILGVCVISVSWGPHSAANLEARVEESANAALTKANLGFWHATAHGRAVDLEGVAPDEQARMDAVELVDAADGVAEVRTQGVNVIPLASPFIWTASRQDSRVVLQGVAPSRAAANAVHEAARRLFGSDMSDDTTLASGAPPGVEWDVAAIQGLEALHRMNGGTAQLVGARLTVSGVATSDVEARQIAALVGNPGIGISATANVVGPSEWSAHAEGGRITLQGSAPSESVRRALVRAAGGDRRVTDSSTIGAGGEWQTRAIAALAFLADFDTGDLRVLGNAFRISGTAPGSVLGYLREDMADIEDNYRIEYDVSEAQPDLSEIAGLNLSAPSANDEACETALNRVAGGERMVFVRGGTKLSRASGPVLDKLVAVARACAVQRIEIQGYAESSGKRGNDLGLSRERAAAVKDYLVERGLSGDRLTAVGFGPDRPIASSRTDAGRAGNRRIEFRIIRKESR